MMWPKRYIFITLSKKKLEQKLLVVIYTRITKFYESNFHNSLLSSRLVRLKLFCLSTVTADSFISRRGGRSNGASTHHCCKHDCDYDPTHSSQPIASNSNGRWWHCIGRANPNGHGLWRTCRGENTPYGVGRRQPGYGSWLINWPLFYLTLLKWLKMFLSIVWWHGMTELRNAILYAVYSLDVY